jgi:NAD(P)-dependent dehydrogenase (short-subunit alcohol dehydrogenase family)
MSDYPDMVVCARRNRLYGEESMDDRLKDKVALVSGAGSSGPGWGNGKATAVLFAREGAKVLAAGLNLDAALETKRIIDTEGGICEVVAGNVCRADDVAAIVDACITAFGRIDVLHNNVGIVEVGGPVETHCEARRPVISSGVTPPGAANARGRNWTSGAGA